ncbi:hypothetical protein PY254_17765 [Rhodanobacter sp. AS-Z3]|uniref:hypothetical protein n=1 Tax=Rhodanobacter sp. AS-Z3 TaxID=3031330 RepID=UPI0024790C55|nr:hypothetical protein [Rhodanobacter sp. AS-Z3]WEN15051.1 hypothetical protein PY254_17765 [Rhodanobacter sp. AS-Z3]
MKYESMMIAGLFATCFALCTLVMGAMLTTTPDSVRLVAAQASTTPATARATCTAAPGATTCPRA